MSDRPQFRDAERCSKCGGRCCSIYLDSKDGGSRNSNIWFEEWVELWDEEFIATGANKVTPFFDPLEIHLVGNEHLKQELIEKGLNPKKCKYCGKEGCILSWEVRPSTCKEYRCKEWRDER